MSLPIRVLSGDWTPFIPNGEPQSSIQDSLGCASFSAVHVIESQIKQLTGRTMDFSERFLAKESNTTTDGNSARTVFETLNITGLVTTDVWPEPDAFDWNSFYAPIPADVQAKGKSFLDDFTVSFFEINKADIPAYLCSCPLWVRLKLPTTYHFVELLNTDTYFDSYQQYVKKLNYPIANAYVLFLTPKHMFNAKRVVKADGQTYGVLVQSPNGDQIIYATNEEQWRSWNKSDSYQLPTVDSTGKTIWQADFTLPF